MSVMKTSLRNFFAHKGRMILSGLAVLLSVAFVCGTLVFTATMQTTFDRLFTVSASNVMVTPGTAEDEGGFDQAPAMTGRPETMPGDLAGTIRDVDGVEEVTGYLDSQSVVAVDADNENIGPTTGAPTIVANWTPVELRTMEIVEGSAPEGSGEVMVDSQTAENSSVAIGDELRLLSVGGTFEATVSGIVEFQVTNPGATVLYVDTPTAQEILLGGEDGYTAFYVDTTGAVSDEEMRDRVASAVDGGQYLVRTSEQYAEDNRNALGEFLDIIRWVLLGFAGIALLVGIFLIVNTFTMLVAQRTREIGLFRAIGAQRGQVNRSVMIEALLLGVIGSVLGFVAGIGIAVALMAILGALGMNLSTDDLTIGWTVPVTGIVLGVTVTLIAAWIPARRAGRITPMAALQDAGNPGDVRAGRIRAAIGAALLALGTVALIAVTGTESAGTAGQLLGVGIPLTLVGLVLAAPALVGLVIRGLSAVLLRGFGSIGRLAERNALRNPRRTGATASALMIGLALVSALSVAGASLVASTDKAIDESIGADFIVQNDNFSPLMPEATEAARGADDLEAISEYRELPAELTPADGGETFDQSLGMVNEAYPQVFSVDVAEGDIDEALAPGGISLTDTVAERQGVELGDELEVLTQGGGTTTLTVRAITVSAGATMEGDLAYIGLEGAEEFVPAEAMPLSWGVFAIAEEGRQAEARASLEAALEPFPQVVVRDQADYKELVRSEVGMLLNMVYGLLALAIIVAVLGVINTLALSVVERTREIGLMRAIGLSRRQLRRMIRLESVVIALFGAVLGVALGLFWGWASQQVMALEGIDVLEIPVDVIVIVFIGSALVGLLAALIPAFRAGRMNILRAIATE
ncbi:FtsX-like permease family protein [Streptomyces calidiresistens]|uniref:FtsX-like permease family protein n=1 Tax=Streptomyces calidiresistens TaxID=1485586 RepID=A0A7W3T536_9ACTN|nr:FtsX-like permease family protein [Streptomyces calidiresistens]MBB0231108.1 FtsX-like permease family protein [Streptomyces calidiresistens]